MNLEEKQQLLDSMIQPETMQYELSTLTPRESMIGRIKVFDDVCPGFFEFGDRLLDVGCGKGFFSLFAARNRSSSFIEAVGIDYNQKAIDLCNEIKEDGTRFICNSFREFAIDAYYDRIFIGNGPHYLFADCHQTWDWIYKLAVLSTDLVLLEGGFNFEDQQMLDLINSEDGASNFTFDKFQNVVEKFFTIEAKVQSSIPGRYVVLLKKKPIQPFDEVQMYDLPILHVFRLGGSVHSTIFLSKYKGQLVFCKLYPIGCIPYSIQLSSMFNGSSDIICMIKWNDKYVGCCEPFIPGENCEESKDLVKVLIAQCKLGIFLAKNGYMDIDIAAGNCIHMDGKITIVDKNQVYPIKGLDERHTNLWSKLLENPNLPLNDSDRKLVEKAVISNDSHNVEIAFTQILNKLEQI